MKDEEVGRARAGRLTKSPVVQFPFARGEDSSAVAIDEYSDGTRVTCFGCDNVLIAKRGEQKRWHFAHSSQVERPCDGETALHRLAKTLIRDAHARARMKSVPYTMEWKCPQCDCKRTVDCAAKWTSAELERRALTGVCSDVLLVGPRPFAIEVVVTHEPEEATLSRYVDGSIPVFTIHPSWETVAELRERIVASSAIGVDCTRCPTCKERFRATKAIRDQRVRLERRLKAFGLRSRAFAEERLGAWPPNDRDLTLDERQRLREQAVLLVRCGLYQHRNPWVFTCRLSDCGRLYAGVRSPMSVRLFLQFTVPVEHLAEFGAVVVLHLREQGLHVDDRWPEDIVILGDRATSALRRRDIVHAAAGFDAQLTG